MHESPVVGKRCGVDLRGRLFLSNFSQVPPRSRHAYARRRCKPPSDDQAPPAAADADRGTTKPTFESVYESRIVGKLCAIDRLIFKGHLTGLMPRGAFARFLFVQSVLLVCFKAYVNRVTGALKSHAQAIAKRAGRPYEYLTGTHTAARGRSKEERARAIAARDGIHEGLITVFAAVEPCSSFEVKGNHETQRLEVVRAARKCLFFYFYIIDRELGFMHIRLQSWFPFSIQVYVNGHEWLCQQLARRKVGFTRSDNKLLWVEDLGLAQRLAQRFAERNWVSLLDALARRVNPYLWQVVRSGFGGYYWVVDQCEIATDVMFKDRRTLEDLLPELYEAAMLHFSSDDVLRFLGRKLHPSLKADVTSDQKRRVEGRRIKHRVGRNAIKMYDHANVLRIETTINQPRDFKIFKHQQTNAGLVGKWVPMQKGVANLRRYFEVGSASNGRYLDALGAISPQVPRSRAVQDLDELCRPHTVDGQHVPRLQPIGPDDCKVFQAVLHGEHAISGFRNRDIAKLIYTTSPSSPDDERRRSARVSRTIARLRGHGLVVKVRGSHLYRITSKGALLMTTAVRVRLRDFPEQYARAA